MHFVKQKTKFVKNATESIWFIVLWLMYYASKKKYNAIQTLWTKITLFLLHRQFMITRKIISDYFRHRRRSIKEYDIKTASTWILVYNEQLPITVTQNELNDPCPICYDGIRKDVSQIRKLPCNHVFHTSCIDHWFLSQWDSLNLNWTCPLCFSNILDCW